MKSLKWLFKLTALFLGLVQVGYSQNNEVEYSFVDIDKNITQKAISTIVQDQNGIIWIGAYGAGIYKNYSADLISYRQEFQNPNSLNSSLVQKAFVDSNNRVWVGTEVGLNVYDENHDHFNRVIFYEGEKALEKVVVRAIAETDGGKILVGTSSHGLYEVDPKNLTGKSVAIDPRPSDPIRIRCLTKRPDGKILMGTSNGLYEYDGNQAKSVVLKGAVTDNGAPFGIETILIDDSGSLWMGTFSDGLLKVESGAMNTYSATRFRITDVRIFTMVQAPDGKILCGTENDGLFVLAKDGSVVKNYRYDKFEVNGIQSNSIWSLFVDDQDRIWMGSYNAGVSVYDKQYDKFKDLESIQNVHNSLQSSSVTSIIKDKKNRLWIGMDGGGIDVYDLERKKFHHLIDPNNQIAQGLTGLDVQNLFLDSGGNLWVATWNSGMYYLPQGSKTFKHFEITNVEGRLRSYRVMSFAEDIDGVVWIGTSSSGLHYFDTKTDEFGYVPDNLFKCEAEIRKVLVDRENTVWVATNRGLLKREHNSNKPFSKLDLVAEEKGIPAEKAMIDMIVSLFEDRYGNLWIGTDGAGLWKYDTRSHKIDWYNSSSANLKQETISNIIESDDGTLWVGGNNGLSYLDKDSGRFVNFDTNDGLLSDDFNFNAAFKDEGGTLYFGNYKGINIVEPDQIAINESRPPIYFTNFKVYNKASNDINETSPFKEAIGKSQHVTLNHKQSVFTVEYAGVNYTRPEKNQYAYYLEGLEETWNFVGNTTSAHYTNLSPGDYTFMVKASNNDGVWNEDVKALKITVLPPWWKTNWAICTYILLLGLFSFLGYRLIRERVREKRMIQFERAKRLQEEELNNRKIQFFTNISHEFRTPLTLILNPLESIMTSNEIKLPKNIKEKLHTVRKNTGRLKRLIDELMDFRKLQLNKFSLKVSKFDGVAFTKEITDHFNEEAALKNIALLFDTEETDIELWSDQGMLEKVLFNILSNAFKITPDNGTITVGVTICKDGKKFPLIDENQVIKAIEISIEDTGSGISQEEVKSVFERFYQVKNMNSQYYGGTGIGLEVVKSFVDLLKGIVVVESEETVGTKFRVFLPLGKDHFNDDEFMRRESVATNGEFSVPEAATELLGTFKDVGSKKTVLVVEDNTELRAYLKQELKSDYHIIEAANGQMGLDAANKRLPDLIITDVVMPEMNGFEFSEALKSDLKTSHIPLLMLTAKTMNEDWVMGIDSGADVYLSKPFDMTVLRSQLKRLLKSRQILLDKLGNDTNNVKIPENTTTLDKNFIARVIDYIVENVADENLNVELLAEELNLSRSQLYRKIKALTGFTANEFLRKIRLEKAKEMIENGDASISEVCFKVGFSSPSYFTKCFKTHFGMLPTELKQG
ncbi:helix-turn-helix domain-containing protein [Euzebyella marina]|uniref:histidine kinase n=1 Tax=Euzebyella marina TaxID=1761453 RepID=A0A3G2L250_9FLAO|nr:two-component regulator propeller domain-containing protein [Euzebyella marina]AYN66329.1 helix-turn-helix domain-containing protein [Euzebyella marina]